MILRKLADAIRQQNWFTVVLEILIVVIGILIGLEVDGWKERRETRQLYRAALKAFMAESISNRELLDQRIRQIEERTPVLEKAIRHLVRCDAEPDIETTLNSVIEMSYSSIRPYQAFIAYEAVASSTRFQEVMSEEFRLLLNSYYSDFFKRHEWLVRNTTTVDPATLFEESEVVAVQETDDVSSVYRQFSYRLSAPLESVCADRKFVRDTYNLAAIYAVNLRMSKAMQGHRDAVDSGLRKEIDRLGQD